VREVFSVGLVVVPWTYLVLSAISNNSAREVLAMSVITMSLFVLGCGVRALIRG
jgi:hypothetical protein